MKFDTKYTKCLIAFSIIVYLNLISNCHNSTIYSKNEISNTFRNIQNLETSNKSNDLNIKKTSKNSNFDSSYLKNNTNENKIKLKKNLRRNIQIKKNNSTSFKIRNFNSAKEIRNLDEKNKNNENLLEHFKDYTYDDSSDDEMGNRLKENNKKQNNYLGFCLIKYKNYFINLHKIKNNEENFFIKFNENIAEFSICKDLYSYDENISGLFVDKVNNILYAGSKDKEKLFIFNKERPKIKNIMIKTNNFNQTNKINTPLPYKKISDVLKNNTNDLISPEIEINDEDEEYLETNKIKNDRELQINENSSTKDNKLFESISVYLPYGDLCNKNNTSDKEIRYSIMYEIICDENAKNPIVEGKDEFHPENCFNQLKIRTIYACPSKLKRYIAWYDKLLLDKQFIAFIFILSGSLLIFFGKYNINLSFTLAIILLSYTFLCSFSYLGDKIDILNIGN